MQTSLIGVKLDNTGSLKQTSQSLEFSATTTVTINISVFGQNSAPINLAGSALVLTVRTSTFSTAKLVMSLQATIDNAGAGLAHFTIPNTAFATALGAYVYDVTLIDSSGNTDQLVPVGSLYIVESSYTPGQAVTPLASQQPLGQGPSGSKDLGWYNVMTYGAKGNGFTDDTNAIKAAIAAAPVCSLIYFPPGTYLVTDTLLISKAQTYIVGAGPQVTIIKFNPASGKACFQFDNGFTGGDRMYGAGIRDMWFAAGNQTQQKIAIDIVDVSGMVIENIWVDPTNSSNVPWRGNSSIGIRIRGREMLSINNVRLWADQPIRISSDPYISSPVNCDHTRISNTYLLSTRGTGSACFTIDDAVMVTNLIVDGDNAWVCDKYGLLWVNTGTEVSNSQNVKFCGIRMEQFLDVAPYCFYIQRGKGLQDLVFRDCQLPSNVHGFYLDGGVVSGIENVTIQDCLSANTNGAFNHLTTLGSVRNLCTINTLFNVGGGTNLNVTPVFSIPRSQSNYPLAETAWYLDSASLTHIQQLTTLLQAAGSSLTNIATANTNPYILDTTNLFTSGNIFQINNQGTAKFQVQSTGSLILNQDLRIANGGAGTIDTVGNIQLQIGATNASSLALGRVGASGVYIVAPGLNSAVAGSTVIGGGGSYFADVRSRHFTGQGTTPTNTPGTGAGTGPTVTITGTDTAGTIQILTGTTPAASATILTFTFSSVYNINAPYPTLTPANAVTAALSGTGLAYVSASSTSNFTLTSGAAALAAGTTYKWYYVVVQ